MGDGDRLVQVMIILLDNAIRHTPAGGEVVLRVGSSAGLDRASNRARDRGAATPEKVSPRIMCHISSSDSTGRKVHGPAIPAGRGSGSRLRWPSCAVITAGSMSIPLLAGAPRSPSGCRWPPTLILATILDTMVNHRWTGSNSDFESSSRARGRFRRSAWVRLERMTDPDPAWIRPKRMQNAGFAVSRR